MAVISFINIFGPQPASNDLRADEPYCDVNADGFIAPNDALAVINYINAFGADSEGQIPAGESSASLASATFESPTPAVQSPNDSLLALLANDVASQPKRR